MDEATGDPCVTIQVTDSGLQFCNFMFEAFWIAYTMENHCLDIVRPQSLTFESDPSPETGRVVLSDVIDFEYTEIPAGDEAGGSCRNGVEPVFPFEFDMYMEVGLETTLGYRVGTSRDIHTVSTTSMLVVTSVLDGCHDPYTPALCSASP